MNKLLRLSEIKIFVAESLANENARKAELVAEQKAIQEKRDPISSAPVTTEERIDAFLDRTRDIGLLYLDDVAAFASAVPIGLARLSHETAVASEIGSGGRLQFEASSHALAFMMTLPENRAHLKAALLARFRETPGALSSAERAALLRPLDERLTAIHTELEQVDAAIAELSFTPAAA